MVKEDFHTQDTLPNIHKSSPCRSIPLKLPKNIGPYKIESLLNKGGMSYLYLGLHPETKEPIAVKVLEPSLLGDDFIVKTFLQEADIISLTDHPNIVTLYGKGEWDGGLYIAMEFIQGITLRQFILQHAMSLHRSLEIILEVASALSHLHTHSIIHGDLKPENIILTESGHIKVIDFGISQLIQGPGEKDNSSKKIMGTPFYMSPEQKENPKAVSYSSDIYSLAIIAYEMIQGNFSQGNVHISLLPKGLRPIFHKCLQSSPSDRFPDIVDFIQKIKQYCASHHIKKDQRGVDSVHEISETLFHSQKTLLPPSPPDWNEVEIGLINHRAHKISGIYFDFLNLNNESYGIIMGESVETGVKGLLFTSMLRGMVHALSFISENPSQMLKILNEVLFHDPIDHIFTLSYLILNPKEDTFHFISCGQGNLWLLPSGKKTPNKIISRNFALGIEKNISLNCVTHPWNVGDTILLHSFSMLKEDSVTDKKQLLEDKYLQLFQDTHYLPAQKQVEIIFRKLHSATAKKDSSRPLTLISLQRKP